MGVNITDGAGDWIKFDLKSPEMMVKTKKMKKLPNGKLVDDLEATAHTAEQQLAVNMTQYYDEIGNKSIECNCDAVYSCNFLFRTEIPTATSIDGTHENIGNVRYPKK